MTPQEMRDRSMKKQGWTHRKLNAHARPYLKSAPDQTMYEGKPGATFTNQDSQFHYYTWDQVKEL